MVLMSKLLSLRFNDEELEIHKALKDFFGIKNTYGEDAATIKMAESGCYNVLHTLFGAKLFDMFRRKHHYEKLSNAQNQEKLR